MRIKKGDTVKVLSGNDKGKTGEVLEVIPGSEKIIVKGINIKKKQAVSNRYSLFSYPLFFFQSLL